MSTKPFVHTVIASLFNLPFPKAYFDIVYSNGVLIHTYSTKIAFESILSHMNDNGMIYVWLVAWERKFKNLRKNKSLNGAMVDLMEIFLRPVIAKLPPILQNAAVYSFAANTYVNYKLHNLLGPFWSKVKNISISPAKQRKFKNILHEARDFWTPVYVQHESVIEVIRWFQENNLDYKLFSYEKAEQTSGMEMDNIGIRGIRNK